MSTSSEIQRRANLRAQAASQEQLDLVAVPNAVRMSLQSNWRFLLRVRGIPVAMVSDVSRPSPNFGAAEEFQLLNWKFKNPSGIVTWDPITFTVRESFDNGLLDSISGIALKKYKELGYDNPNQVDVNNLKDMSKSSLMESMGEVAVQIINPDGDVYEQWTLYNAFVTGIKFSPLSYTGASLLGTTFTVTYDWASLTYVNNIGTTKTY